MPLSPLLIMLTGPEVLDPLTRGFEKRKKNFDCTRNESLYLDPQLEGIV